MKYSILAALLALTTTLASFFALIYPAWFQQIYQENDPDVFQGFGIWAFTSSATISDPFYASETNLQYKDICKKDAVYPNWMLGGGEQYADALCGTIMSVIQACVAVSACFSALVLLASIAAVFSPHVGFAERIISSLTLFGSLAFSVSLVIWGWMVQRNLYHIDRIHDQYQACKSSKEDWSCWFYGRSFWVGLGAVVLMSLTGYANAAARNAKCMRSRKLYEGNLQAAMQASMSTQVPHQPVYTNYQTPQARAGVVV